MRTLFAAAAAAAALFAAPALAQEAPGAVPAEVAQFQAEVQAFTKVVEGLELQAAPIRADVALTDAQKAEKIDALIAGKTNEIDAFITQVTAFARSQATALGAAGPELEAELANIRPMVVADVRDSLLTGDSGGDDGETE